ncbi:MAG TPA: hypothetical protein VFC60_00985 [Tissierellaceae bacterium]|nr:hypothetical protein [Tissierellaceae bacterium]
MKKGVVVTFGGSEGSSNMDVAKKVAKEGYEVYSMYFLGKENQRDSELVLLLASKYLPQWGLAPLAN